jgi:hypothetical protein
MIYVSPANKELDFESSGLVSSFVLRCNGRLHVRVDLAGISKPSNDDSR